MSHLGSLQRMTQHQEKGWRDERMDGENGGGVVGRREEKKKGKETRDKEEYKNRRRRQILLGDVAFKYTTRKNKNCERLIHRWRECGRDTVRGGREGTNTE